LSKTSKERERERERDRERERERKKERERGGTGNRSAERSEICYRLKTSGFIKLIVLAAAATTKTHSSPAANPDILL
jgi:hypothetical protein